MVTRTGRKMNSMIRAGHDMNQEAFAQLDPEQREQFVNMRWGVK